jgi:hypothetical protein
VVRAAGIVIAFPQRDVHLDTLSPLEVRLARPDGKGTADVREAQLADRREAEVKSPLSGIVIGRTELPLANEGEALYHLAPFDELAAVEKKVDIFPAALDPETGDVPRLEPQGI